MIFNIQIHRLSKESSRFYLFFDFPDFNHSFQHYQWIGFWMIVYNLDEPYLSYLISLHSSWKSSLHSPPNRFSPFGVSQHPLPWSNSEDASGSSPSLFSLLFLPFDFSPHSPLRTHADDMLLFYVCFPFCLWLPRSTESTDCILRFLERFPHNC